MIRTTLALTVAIAMAGTSSAVTRDPDDIRSDPAMAPHVIPACWPVPARPIIRPNIPGDKTPPPAPKPVKPYAVCGLGADGNGYVVDWDFAVAHDETLALAGDQDAALVLCTFSTKAQVEWCRQGATNGDTDAMVRLGQIYEHAIGAPFDLKEAIRWYRTAAERGNAEASVRLAALYDEGWGVERNPVAAEAWRRKAGYRVPLPDAKAPEGCTWYEGRPDPLLICETPGGNVRLHSGEPPYLSRIDYKGLTEHTIAEAEVGKLEAMEILGGFYVETANLLLESAKAERTSKGLKLLQAAADRGDVYAMFQIGEAYQVHIPHTKADDILHWYRLAAQHGSAHAELALAFMYAEGDRVTADKVEAARAFNHAAALDPLHVAAIVAKLYAEGWHLDKSEAEAFRLYLVAANAGDPKAMCPLAEIYSSGTAVAKNEAEAVRWRRTAFEKGGIYCKPANYIHRSYLYDPDSAWVRRCVRLKETDPETGRGREQCTRDHGTSTYIMNGVNWPQV